MVDYFAPAVTTLDVTNDSSEAKGKREFRDSDAQNNVTVSPV